MSTHFNLIVYNVVHNWLALTVYDPLVSQEGLRLTVGWCLGIFYTNDDVVGLQDTEWLQGSLNVIIGLFHHNRLLANVVKEKEMTCQTGTIRYRMSEEAVGR